MLSHDNLIFATSALQDIYNFKQVSNSLTNYLYGVKCYHDNLIWVTTVLNMEYKFKEVHTLHMCTKTVVSGAFHL